MHKLTVVFILVLCLFGNICFAQKHEESGKSAVAIQSINYKIFDRQKGKFIEAKESPSDPYGMHNDLYVEVKLKGAKKDSSAFKIFLTATTPKTSDEARGDVAATTQKLTKDDIYLADDGKLTTIPFLLKFECNPMIIKVELPALKLVQQIKLDLGCAE